MVLRDRWLSQWLDKRYLSPQQDCNVCKRLKTSPSLICTKIKKGRWVEVPSEFQGLLEFYSKISTSLHDVASLVWSILKDWHFHCVYIPITISPNYHSLELYSRTTSIHSKVWVYPKVALLMERFWCSQVKLSPGGKIIMMVGEDNLTCWLYTRQQLIHLKATFH